MSLKAVSTVLSLLPLLDAACISPLAVPKPLILYSLVLCLLLSISLIDAKTMEIPNSLCVALFACGILAVFVVPELAFSSRLIGLFCISIPLLTISLILPGSFGGGDIKLMAAAGFLLGWQDTLIAACIGILIGGFYGVYLIAFRRKTAKQCFAFGPALCTGIAVSLLFGSNIAHWYFFLL